MVISGTAQSLDRAFLAVAQANGMSIRYGIPGFVAVDNYIDGGGPASQAVVGSDGSAGAFASLPYPGEAAVGYPGLVNLVTGQTPPGYPFYVNASHPTQPEQALSDPSGAYSLRATAKESHATGDAEFAPSTSGDTPGPPGAGQDDPVPISKASSGVVTAGPAVTATASSVANGLTLGPLSIGRVSSQSVTTYTEGDDKPSTTTELAIEGGRANDVAFSFGREGFQFSQQGIPLPASEGLAAINQTLAPAGLSVRFDEAAPLEGGAVAAAFEVASVAEVPGAGTGTFVIRFGGATSFISLAAAGGTPLVGGVTPPPPFEAPASDPVAPGPAPVAAPPVTLPAGGTDVAGSLDLPVPGFAPNGPAGFATSGGYSPGADPSPGLYDANAGVVGGAGLPTPAVTGSSSALSAARPAQLAVGQRGVGGMSILGGVLMVGAVLGVALSALGTRRARAWMG